MGTNRRRSRTPDPPVVRYSFLIARSYLEEGDGSFLDLEEALDETFGPLRVFRDQHKGTMFVEWARGGITRHNLRHHLRYETTTEEGELWLLLNTPKHAVIRTTSQRATASTN